MMVNKNTWVMSTFKLLSMFPPRYFLPQNISVHEFRHRETETVVYNIVCIQRNLNLDSWTPFSFQYYRQACSHNVQQEEELILEALVNGGKPLPSSSVQLMPSYLSKKDNNYVITDKFIELIRGK